MKGIAEYLFFRPVFHQIAEIHYTDSIGNVLDYRKVVAYKEIRELELILKIVQKIDDLGLDRYVESGDRLVTDYEFRVQGKGSRNAYTLSLAARELMGITVFVERLKTAVVHDGVYIVVIFLFRNDIMLSYRFPDYLTYGHTGREGRKRILEDYLHLGAHGAQIFFGQSVNILPVEVN